MFPKKQKQEVNPSITLSPQDDFSGSIYRQEPNQQFQQPVQQTQQFQQNQPIQQVQQPKPETKAVITKVELIDGIIHFVGQANYLINIGDCQIN